MSILNIVPGQLTLADLRRVSRETGLKLQLDASCHAGIDASAATVARVLSEGRTAYGINTGFGLLANTRIAADELELLQRSIVLSHAAGIGAPMDDSTVRLVMALKINSLARGFSGIRRQVIEALVTLFNHGIYPVIPQKGSVGASGDLAPLSHMSAVLIGEGEAFVNGQRVHGREAMQALPVWNPSPWPRKKAWPAQRHAGLHRLCAGRPVCGGRPVCLRRGGGSMSVEAAQGSRTRLMRASTPCAAMPGRLTPPAPTARCWNTAKSNTRTKTAARCRTRTACAASRR
jgi:histidine ammonia-lyase